jgi:MoaA/NifB/PqqE/SkfB family radical SAM enzyme
MQWNPTKIRKTFREPQVAWSYLHRKVSHFPYWIAKAGYNSKLGFSFPPLRIAIAVNSVCNMRCAMCDIGQRQEDLEFYKNVRGRETTLSFQAFKELIDEVKRFRPVIAFNLVEPLLRKDIVAFVRYVKKSGLNCSITTNGYLLEKFAIKFVEDRATLIYVSIDGVPEVHNKIRGVTDCFQKAYKGIQKLIEARKESNQTLPKIYVCYTISNYNSHCLDETAGIFKDLGVDGIIFVHLNFITENMAKAHNEIFGHLYKVAPSSVSVIDPENMNVSELQKQVRLVKRNYSKTFAIFSPDIATLNEIRTYYNNPEIFVSKPKCSILWRNAQILSNGDVVPGSRCFDIVMGNINRDSFLEIWNNPTIRNSRKELRKIGATPACSRCCGIF